MNRIKIGSNQYISTVKPATIVYWSYETPVAAITGSGKVYVTEVHYSVTTSRHINQWLGGRKGVAERKPQEFFDNLVKEQ